VVIKDQTCPEHADLVHLIEILRAKAGVQDTPSRVILRIVDFVQRALTPDAPNKSKAR